MSIIIFIVILLVLVLVHEAGHFFTAKKFGVKVDEFGFGFPPKLFSFKKGETEYSFNLLPLGGFVKIFGENPDEDNTNGPDAGRSFVNKPKWQQAIVLFAGVFANFVLAWFLFSFGFMSGLPISIGSEHSSYKLEDINLVVVSVFPKSPALNAGLKVGDKIINVSAQGGSTSDGKSGNNFINYLSPETIKSFITENTGREISIEYTRGENSEIGIAKINTEKINGEPAIVGISMDQIGKAKLPFFSALLEGMKLNWSMTKNTVFGLYGLISESIKGKGSLASVAGPVGLVGMVGDAYQFGFVHLLSFAAIISINLAIINLLPFPALDGGRLFFLLIEKIKGSRINPKVANTVNMIGFCILILLMVVVTYHDVVKLF